MYVGIGASRVRDLFTEGKKKAPCIIFIDEIDAVGRHRSAGGGPGGNDEREQTLNQLLVEMDGFEVSDHVIVVAATNRQDILDPALLRPGRFDRQVMVPLPDVGGREKILRVHARRTRTAENVDWQTIARATPGFSGAQLASLVNEAALLRDPPERPAITMDILEAAKDKVLMGAERAQPDHHRAGEADHRLPRGRPRPGRLDAARRRPGAQGDHHPARPRPGR